MYYIYILRCEDNSLYTGITTDIKRRFSEHKNKSSQSANYTKTHNVLSVEALISTEERGDALRLEYLIKKLTKRQKEDAIKNESLIFEIYSERLDRRKYKILHKNIISNMLE